MNPSEPVSYLTLRPGAPVRSSDGSDVGTVAHVLADADADIFDGLIIDSAAGGHRFVDAPEVDTIDAGGVTLRISAEAAERLPAPTANPATMQTGPDDMAPTHLADKLRRAWDVISGNT